MVLSRVGVIARTVFLEVIRDRILYLVALFALLMVMAAVLLPEVAAGAEDKILLDLGLAGIHLLSVIVAVFVGTGLINREIEKRTVLVLIAKPVSRAAFIVGKHLGLTAVLAVLIAALGIIFMAVLTAHGVAFPVGHRLWRLHQLAAGHAAHLCGLPDGPSEPRYRRLWQAQRQS